MQHRLILNVHLADTPSHFSKVTSILQLNATYYRNADYAKSVQITCSIDSFSMPVLPETVLEAT